MQAINPIRNPLYLHVATELKKYLLAMIYTQAPGTR